MASTSRAKRGGHNNNPTAKQFKAAYTRLLAHHEVMTSDSANCSILDSTSIVNVTSENVYLNTINESDIHREDISNWSDAKAVVEDHNYCVNAYRHQSQYSEDVIGYVAGFVVRKLKKKLKCVDCISAIDMKTRCASKLLLRKNRGGLSFPSEDITNLCKLGEKVFRICNASGKLHAHNIMPRLIVSGLTEVLSKGLDVFSTLKDHSLDHAPQENHPVYLMKAVFFEYFKIRLSHVGKSETEKLQSNNTRSSNTKTTLFKGH